MISIKKNGEIFKDMPYVFSIADDILIVGYDADGRDRAWQNPETGYADMLSKI